MMGPLFASQPQMWPAFPMAGMAYLQTPEFLGGRSFTGPAGPITNQPAPFGGSITPNPAIATPPTGDPSAFASGVVPTAPMSLPVPGWFGFTPGPFASGAPVFASPEVGIGISAPALLATVAMRRGPAPRPTSDQELEDFISDALDLLPGADDVEVRIENGRATLTGSVPHKRIKRDVGEIVWAIPNINDVQNNVTIATRRRSRTSGRESETPSAAARKQP